MLLHCGAPLRHSHRSVTGFLGSPSKLLYRSGHPLPNSGRWWREQGRTVHVPPFSSANPLDMAADEAHLMGGGCEEYAACIIATDVHARGCWSVPCIHNPRFPAAPRRQGEGAFPFKL